jgi:histidine ammonia-lyase
LEVARVEVRTANINFKFKITETKIKISMETLIITGNDLKVNDVVNVARYRQKVELDPDAKKRILECRAMLEKKIVAHEIMYGVNTGIGEFSEIILSLIHISEPTRPY